MKIKLLATLLFLGSVTFGQTNREKTDNCFSESNFGCVYNFIDTQIKKNNSTFYKYDDYELHLTDTTEIALKKDGFTLSKILKDKGFVCLAKYKKDNKNILIKTNKVFCELLLLAKNDSDK